MTKVTNVWNEPQIQFIIRNPDGPLAKNMMKRGKRVESQAKRNLGGGTGSGPRRIATGRLRASVKVQLIVTPISQQIRVGTNVRYARWIHDGTGIFGPKHAPITPRTARVLVFKSKYSKIIKGKNRGKVFARSVKGIKANPFLKNALWAFRL